MNRTQQKLVREAEQQVEKGKFPRYGFWTAVFTMLYGLYTYFNSGYLDSVIDDRFGFITEQMIVVATVISGLIKFTGIALNSGFIKRLGIISLSFVWGVLFSLSFIWSIGAGYPAQTFILYGYILVICLNVAYKGDFS